MASQGSKKSAVWRLDMAKVIAAAVQAPAFQHLTHGRRAWLATIARISGVSYPVMQRAGKGQPIEKRGAELLAKAIGLKLEDIAVLVDAEGNVVPVQQDLPNVPPPAAPPPAAPPAPAAAASVAEPASAPVIDAPASAKAA